MRNLKVERGLYTADTGRAGGTVINVITRSGTSDFHGDVYEFIRNNAFAANNWINNADKANVVNGVAQVPALRWNEIGGPLYVPGHYNKDRNKTFFFFSEEARRIHTYTNFNPILPTQAMLTGNFSAPVCVSYTTSYQATASQIPTSQINPAAAAYIKDIFSKLALPSVNTVAAQSAGFFPVQNIYNSRQEIIRVDHTATDKVSLWGKFENDSIPTVEPGGLFTGAAIPGIAVTNTNAPGRSFVMHAVETIRPNFLNDMAFNFSQSAINSMPAGLIHGPHMVRFGVSFNRYNKKENAANQEGGFASSNPGNPGASANNFNQSFANFLLGNVATFTQPSRDITPDLWATQTEAWIQDDYRISTRLTAYVGVRYSYFGQPIDPHGLLDNFNPAFYNPVNAPQINPARETSSPEPGTIRA